MTIPQPFAVGPGEVAHDDGGNAREDDDAFQQAGGMGQAGPALLEPQLNHRQHDGAGAGRYGRPRQPGVSLLVARGLAIRFEPERSDRCGEELQRAVQDGERCQ